MVDKEAVTDGNLITSRNPDDIPAFSKAFIEMLGENAEKRDGNRLTPREPDPMGALPQRCGGLSRITLRLAIF